MAIGTQIQLRVDHNKKTIEYNLKLLAELKHNLIFQPWLDLVLSCQNVVPT